MAFEAGTFAVDGANAQVEAQYMTSPYGVVAYEPDGITVTIGNRLTRASVNHTPLCFLQLDATSQLEQGMLSLWLDNTFDGSQTDTGVFTTASSAVGAAEGDGAYSLPANFGPGRGRWTAFDVSRLNVLITCTVFDRLGIQAPVYAAPLAFYPRTLVGGNVRIAVKNVSAQALRTLGISFQYRWSGEE